MTLSISILSPPTKTLQFAIGILPLYIQQFSCLGCFLKLATPLIVTIFEPFSDASCSTIMFICVFVFVFVIIFILLLPLFEYSISMVVNRRGHRESNPDLEIRILLCYPLHHAPIFDKAGRGTRSRTEVQRFVAPDAIHYTTPPCCALSKTAIAHCVITNAAMLPNPRSVALTAKTEGPLQQSWFVEFWSPHISHLFRYIIHSSITHNKLSLSCLFPGNNSVCVSA